MYIGYRKRFDTHVLHQVYDRIILHFSHRGTHYEPSLCSTIFVTTADVVTEAFACLVRYKWRFSQRV
jgi:hypothetical protein